METEVKSEKHAAKKPLWRRIVKGLLWFLGGTLVFILVALLTLPLWINPVATSLAQALVPSYTGTAFKLERVELNPYTGKMLISGVGLANPDGYSEKDAFTLGLLSVDVEVTTLLSDTIHVRDITIDAPFASYVFDAEGVNNFDRIIEEVNKKLGPKKEKEEKSETKVVIDRVTIKDVKVAVCTGRFELASLVVTDFGKPTAATIKLEGAKLVNPAGFPEPDAFSLKSLSIGMETADLSKKPLVFHDIIVASPYAGLVYNDAGESNVDAMFKRFMDKGEGEEKKEDGEKKDGEAKEDDTPHVQIDKLEITGTKLQWRKVSLPIPLPIFTDIGKASKEGASMKEVADQVLAKAKDAMGSLGDLAGTIGNGVSNALGGASGMLEGATGAISGGTSNVLSNAKGLLGNVLPGGEKKEGDGTSMAKKTIEGAKSAGKAIGEGTVNLGAGAVDGAKKIGAGALDGVKGLFGGDKKE